MSKSNHISMRMIGAFAPSSQKLALAMTRYVDEKCMSKHILEVGAGTGAITKSLVKKMQGAQQLDVVEIMPALASVLRLRFGGVNNLMLHCSNILNFDTDCRYDLIVSSLPFNAFPPELTQAVMDRLVYLANDNAILSFFEYKILETVAPVVLSKKRREQYYASRALIERFLDRFKFDEARVKMNLPPAMVHYLRIDKSGKDWLRS